MEVASVALRVRGTFIDFCPDVGGGVRASSAPPGHRSEHSAVNDSRQYLTALIQNVQKGIRPLDSPACRCGEQLLPSASFCHGCGGTKPQSQGTIADTIQAENDGCQYLKWATHDMMRVVQAPVKFASSGNESNYDRVSACQGSFDRLPLTSSCTYPSNRDELSPVSPSAGHDDWSETRAALRGQPAQSTGMITTMMVLDIPCRKNIDDLVDLINKCGFVNTYDFVCLPGRKLPNPKKCGNMGYGFVNFKTPGFASDFAKVFDCITFPGTTTTKKSYAKPARIQGYEAYLQMYKSKRRENFSFFP